MYYQILVVKLLQIFTYLGIYLKTQIIKYKVIKLYHLISLYLHFLDKSTDYRKPDCAQDGP